MIILNQKKGLGDILGESLAQGFGGGLDYLFEHKYGQLRDKYEQEKQEKQYKKNLSDLISSGYSEPEANKLLTLARIDPRLAASSMKSGISAFNQNPEDQYRSLVNAGIPDPEARAITDLYKNNPRAADKLLSGSIQNRGSEATANAINAITQGKPIEPKSGINPKDLISLSNFAATQRRAEMDRIDRRIRDAKADKRHEDTLALKKDLTELKKQSEIADNNRPFLTKLSKGNENSQNLFTTVNEMIDLKKQSGVAQGLWGNVVNYTGNVLQNKPTQRFVQLGNKLANDYAGQSGIATNFKIKTAQTIKPNITTANEVQDEGLQDILKETTRVINQQNLGEDIIMRNGGKEPPHIEAEIHKELKQVERIPLPNVEQYPNRTIIKKDGYKFERVSNAWICLGKA